LVFFLPVKAKVEVHLVENDLPPLGYAPHIMPEEQWLTKVARYLDRTNSSAIFLYPIPNAPAPNTLTQRMMRAKAACKEHLFGDPRIRNDKDVIADVESLWQAQKKFVNRRREVEALQAHLDACTAKLNRQNNIVSACLSRAAMTVYKLGTEDNDPESVYVENAAGANVRVQATQIQRLYAPTLTQPEVHSRGRRSSQPRA